MTGFEGVLTIDIGKQPAMIHCSETITDFIYSPFDTPATASGGVILF
jgi:hypothetical protein